jgi:hypothetical protein
VKEANARVSEQTLLELMIPPQTGWVVWWDPSRIRDVPGSVPGLAYLFSSYRHDIRKRPSNSNIITIISVTDSDHSNNDNITMSPTIYHVSFAWAKWLKTSSSGRSSMATSALINEEKSQFLC